MKKKNLKNLKLKKAIVSQINGGANNDGANNASDTVRSGTGASGTVGKYTYYLHCWNDKTIHPYICYSYYC